MSDNRSCPCGSKHTYEQCCQPIHVDTKQAIQPEQLMRARYSAHVLKNIDFVIATYHSSCQAALQAEAVAESVDSDWVELDVLEAPPPQNAEEGYVEFKAYFEENGQRYCLHERSRFIKEEQEWRYIDGVMPEENTDLRLNQTIAKTKIGRNDPCLCGSGKKFKKCCG